MAELKDVTRPGLMISQTWPTTRETEGKTLEVIEKSLDLGFFEAFQTVEIPYASERRAVAKLLPDMPLTYCLARVLNEKKLNLADGDEANRKRSCDHLIRCLDDAREAGAGGVALISGPAPATEKERREGLARIQESLAAIAEAARTSPEVKVIIEPLDVRAHKKNTLGYAHEAFAICRNLKKQGIAVGLCLDTAHQYLNGEDPIKTLEEGMEFAWEFHFCNCVTEPSHELFGDRHMPFGPPGILDAPAIGGLMAGAVEAGYFTPQKRPTIFCEVLKRPEDEPEQVIDHVKSYLLEGWAQSGKA